MSLENSFSEAIASVWRISASDLGFSFVMIFFVKAIAFLIGLGHNIIRNSLVTQRDVGVFVPSVIQTVSFYIFFDTQYWDKLYRRNRKT